MVFASRLSAGRSRRRVARAPVFATELRTTTISKTRAQRAPPRSSEAPVATTGERASLSRRVSMAVKPVAAPPPPRRDVEDRAGTLQGQLRALSEAVLRGADDARSRASTSGRDARARDAAVRRLQGRAFEVLLRLDATVDAGKPPTAAERAENNALRLGTHLLAMRARGAGDAADVLERLVDAFAARPTALLPHTPYTDAGPTPRARAHPSGRDRRPGARDRSNHGFEYDARDPRREPERDAETSIEEHDATVALLLALAGTGREGRDDVANRGAPGTAQNLERLSSAFARLAATDADSRDDTAAARRAERACAWLSLAPASILESTPRFGRRDEGFAAAEDVVVAPALPAIGSDVEMDAPPRAGALALGTVSSRSDRRGFDRASDASLFGALPASDGSLFGALARSRIPNPNPRANEDALDVRLTVPPRGEGGFLDPAWLADRRAGDIFTPEREDSNDSNPNPNPSETRDVRRDEEASPSDAKGDAEAWLAAATCSSSSNAPTLGWDLGDMRPACGAFMTRGSRAFGRAYDAHLRPAARLFSGGAGPATATEEELVASASRALAGERAATSAIRTDAFGSRERPSLRLPAASAGAVAATLAPLATAAERRAALDAFARDSSGFGIGRGFQGSRGFGLGESASLRVCESASLATQAAAAATRAILRAHDAALRALPSAAARRRAAERAAGAPLASAYARLDEKRRDGAEAEAETDDGANATTSTSGVTLLEARAHTRRLRAQLATLSSLFARADSNAPFPDGVVFLSRLTSALSSGGLDPAARPLLRRLADAASRPALAQLRSWMHRARVDDPHGEFIVRTSDGWGSDAGALEYAAAEASALRWASGATDDAEESRDALAEATDEDAARDVARLAPWEGGPPGRVGASAAARAGATLGSEAAWLRESTDACAHPLFAGMERVALATGVQLRVLQRLPQTASFARRFASIGYDEDDSDASGFSSGSPSESSSAWRLAFSPAALASASSRRRRETAAMERAADDAIASMAATRAAHGARAEARRRARLAADVARRVESESLVAEARASLLEGFAERVAVIAARRERARWRRAEEVEGPDAKANAASRAAEDEANIRAELARELAAAEARATPKPTEKTDANATRTPSNAARTPSNARTPSLARTPPFSRSLSPADVGSSPGSYFRNLASDRLDASADAADESFRTADDAPASPDRSLDLSMRSADATMRSAPSTPGDKGDTPGVETRTGEPDAFFATTNTPGSPDLADSIESDSDAFGVDAESVLEDAADLFSTMREDPLETPFPVTLAECVSRAVLDRHRVVSRLATAAMLDHLGAETHAAAVGKYILCGAGDFSSALVEGVEAAARADAARGGWGATSHALRDALHAAVKESAASADPLAARVALRPRTEEVSRLAGDGVSRLDRSSFSEHSARMMDHVDAEYRVEWPVSLLFPSSSRALLADANRATLRGKHASSALREAHARVHEAGRAMYSSRGAPKLRTTPATRRLRRLALLSSEFRHFARAVESHAGCRVHGAAAGRLAARLRDAKTGAPRPSDLYELRDAMMEHARNAHEGCLLADRDAPLRAAVDDALQLALDFRAALRRCPTESLSSDGGVYATVQTIHARFKMAVRRTCERLREAAADGGGALGGVSPGTAAALLAEIDHNGYYLGGRE